MTFVLIMLLLLSPCCVSVLPVSFLESRFCSCVGKRLRGFVILLGG